MTSERKLQNHARQPGHDQSLCQHHLVVSRHEINSAAQYYDVTPVTIQKTVQSPKKLPKSYRIDLERPLYGHSNQSTIQSNE